MKKLQRKRRRKAKNRRNETQIWAQRNIKPNPTRRLQYK